MNPGKLIGALLKKGIHLTHNGGVLNYWPSHLVSVSDLEEIKRSKAQIIRYLRGDYQLQRGDPVSTEYGNLNVWEVYPEQDRVGLTGIEGERTFRSYREIASLKQFEFLKRRFNYIEAYVYGRPETKWNDVFARFRPEWVFLLRELCRQQFLLETWCGPLENGKSTSSIEVHHVA